MSKKRSSNNNNNANSGKDYRKNGYSKNTKNSQKNTSADTSTTVVPRTNDSDWYTANAKLVEASARISFPYRPGLRLPEYFGNCQDNMTVTNIMAQPKLPGVFAIDWYPSIGVSSDVTSPISLAARDIFSKVRSAFSGSIQADAPDFIIHMMAMDSVYSYISHLKRIYKIIVTFNVDNQITPEVVLRTMGWSDEQINDLMVSKVKLYGAINELISMTNRFYTPNIMPVFKRHVWMSERIYCDSPTVNSQMYLFNLTHVFKFGIDDNGAGKLTLEKVPHAGTVADLFNFGKDLIQAISDWDDGYIINGYLTKAYDSQARFQIADLDMSERVELVYNEVVLSQIENATCAPVEVSNITGSITQNVNSNALISSYKAKPALLTGNYWTLNRVNCRSEQPSAIDVIEATRLMTKWHLNSANEATVVECGTEVVTNFRIMKYTTELKQWQSVNVNNMVLVTQPNGQMAVTIAKGLLSKFADAITTFSAFDWHPIMLTGTQTHIDDTKSTDYISMLGDIHNITFINDEDMAYINRCCLYSEFGSFGD